MNTIAVKGVMAQPVTEPGRGGLTTRVLSAVVLAPPVLAIVYLGSPYFEILIAVAAAILVWEWNRLCGVEPSAARNGPREAPAMSPANRTLWRVLGLLYVVIPCLALVWLRADQELGRETVFWLIAVVWATDIGAYAFGSLIGGPRLAPAVSPNKTWAGLIGGILCAGAIGAATVTVLGRGDIAVLVAISAVLGLTAQGGDLLESLFKRRFGAKDAGNIIPGHGGLFDRVDGLLAAAVATVAIGLAGKGGVLTW